MGNSDDDINIANGTCYYGPGKEAHQLFIPCGNVDFGHTMCCWAGSFCFAEGHTCFKQDVATTYMAGCTDSTYEDSSCPDKKIYKDQPWTGMIFCNVDDTDVWAGCEEKGNPAVLHHGEECHCTADMSPAIESRIVLTAAIQIASRFASLPQAAGESIQWQDGFTPTGTRIAEKTPITTPDLSSATSSNTNRDSAVVSATSTTNESTAGPSTTTTPDLAAPTGSLGTPERIGIGFGAVVGLMLILGALFAIRTLRHRKQVNDPVPEPEQAGDPAGTKGDRAAELATPTFPVLGELQTENKARPETLRSELAGSSPTSPHSSHLSGMSDHGTWRPAMHLQSHAASIPPPHAYPTTFPWHGYPTALSAPGSYPASFPQQGYPTSYPHQDYPTSVSPELGVHSVHLGQNVGHEGNRGNEGQQHGAMELPG